MLHSPIEPCLTPDDADVIERAFGRAAFAADGTILRVNDRLLSIFGYEGIDLVGRSRSILAPGRADGGEGDVVDRVFADAAPFAGDVRHARRDGTPFWAEASYTPIVDPDGTVREVVVLMRDVTARMMAAADEAGQIAAINTSQAVIHFAVDGTILSANPLFLATTGYALADIVGRHHRMFVDPVEAASAEYAELWERLRAGSHASGEYRRLTRTGEAVWLRATYNPILDLDGRPFKIVKYAVDVTTEKKQYADFRGQIAAIDTSQCIVTYALDGTILNANRHFLATSGYAIDELEGRHHRMFVEPAHAHSLDYEIFWSDLAAGQYRSGEFRRIGKDGRDIWFQSIYSPVLDQDGRPFKIVNYATAITREKLRQADHQSQIAAIHKSQSVVSFTIDGTILDANDNFLELTGYRLSQVLGRHHSMFVAAEDRDDGYAEFWRDLAAGNYKRGEFKRVGQDGREVWIQASYNPIFDMNGRPFKVVKNAVDVSEQKLRQGDYEGQIAAIRKSQCVVSFDLDGTVLDANDNFLRLMGYELADVVGRHHRLFVDPDTVDSHDYAELWASLREGRFLSSKFRRITRDGSDVWIQASYNPIHDLNGRPFKIVKIATDITADVSLAADLSRAQREVQHDPATGLPNRLGLRRFLKEALAATDSELALLYLDLDHFKPINDTFGHDVGDHVLKTVAARLRREVGDDQIVARIGGDEFVVAAPGMPREDVATLARRLIEAVSQPIPHRDRHLEVGLSIGVALTPGDTLDEDELFRFADVALYRSKGNQRGTVTFYGEATAPSAEEERHLAHEMRIAIKATQFALWGTPLHADPGAPENAPAVVALSASWDHPTLGRLSEERFGRIAEQSGLILPLGDWMLREACRLAIGWREVTVSIPIYPRQLLSGDVPGMVALALRETGLDPRRLELRVERGTSRVNAASLQPGLADLQAMGIVLVGDGFLFGDDVPASGGRWPVDRVSVDPRLRTLLARQAHDLHHAIAAVEARDAALPADRRRRFEVDRDGTLRSLVAHPAMPAAAVTQMLSG